MKCDLRKMTVNSCSNTDKQKVIRRINWKGILSLLNIAHFPRDRLAQIDFYIFLL
jgi:hypothetical protein